MRVLMLNFSEITHPGGVHKVIKEVGRRLSRRGHEIFVLQGNPYNKPSKDILNGLTIVRIHSPIANKLYGLSPELYRYIINNLIEIAPDIVHVHGYHTLFSLSGILAIRKINRDIPIVFSPHYMPQGHSTLAGKFLWSHYNTISNFWVSRIDHIIVASDFEKESLLSDIPSSRGINISVIPHGVDMMAVKKRKIRKITPPIKLVYAGYLQKRKGIHYILHALHELVSKYNIHDISLKIIGEGEYKRELLTLAKKLSITEFIEWKPFIRDRSQFLKEIQDSDIFLLLSSNENYGISVAESLAMGTPVIVTETSALKEFLNEPGCFGVPYPPDPTNIAKLILNITFTNVQIGPFKNIYTWEEITSKYERLYLSLVK